MLWEKVSIGVLKCKFNIHVKKLNVKIDVDKKLTNHENVSVFLEIVKQRSLVDVSKLFK